MTEGIAQCIWNNYILKLDNNYLSSLMFVCPCVCVSLSVCFPKCLLDFFLSHEKYRICFVRQLGHKISRPSSLAPWDCWNQAFSGRLTWRQSWDREVGCLYSVSCEGIWARQGSWNRPKEFPTSCIFILSSNSSVFWRSANMALKFEPGLIMWAPNFIY